LDHPKAGVHLEGLPDATPVDLWRQHQERVAELSGERFSPVLRHDSMSLRIWIAERCREIGNFVALAGLFIGFLAFVGVLASILQFMEWFNAQARAWFGPWFPLFWLVGIFLMCGAAMWLGRRRVLGGWLGGHWLARQLAWPRRRRYETARIDIGHGPDISLPR
jgi:hypothetical protein